MLLSLLALVASQPAAAPHSADERLRACVALVRTAPSQAATEAQAWLEEAGSNRAMARRCLGLAFAATLNAPIEDQARFGLFRM